MEKKVSAKFVPGTPRMEKRRYRNVPLARMKVVLRRRGNRPGGIDRPPPESDTKSLRFRYV